MAEITASMVKELREKTDAPMMECKKALTEAGRRHGEGRGNPARQAGQQGQQGRDPRRRRGRGGDPHRRRRQAGQHFRVNCETDFVAKNDDFLKPGRQGPAPAGGRTRTRPTWPPCRPCRWARARSIDPHRAGRQDRREHEHPPLRALIAAKGKLASYIHGGFEDRRAGRRGRRRRATRQGPGDAHRRLEAEVADDSSACPAELLDTERRIAIEKAREAGKPEAMLEKIAEGTVQKFLKE
jgi:elongation factor Ts